MLFREGLVNAKAFGRLLKRCIRLICLKGLMHPSCTKTGSLSRAVEKFSVAGDSTPEPKS